MSRIEFGIVALLLVSGLAGCGRENNDAAFAAELEAADSSGGLLMSSAPRVEVMSAVERGTPAKTPNAGRTAGGGRRTSSSASTPAPEPRLKAAEIAIDAPVLADPSPTMGPTQAPVPTAPRPSPPVGTTRRPPPGGWKTPGEVIRNAPFPINP